MYFGFPHGVEENPPSTSARGFFLLQEKVSALTALLTRYRHSVVLMVSFHRIRSYSPKRTLAHLNGVLSLESFTTLPESVTLRWLLGDCQVQTTFP